jgi:hypothetical protein
LHQQDPDGITKPSQQGPHQQDPDGITKPSQQVPHQQDPDGITKPSQAPNLFSSGSRCHPHLTGKQADRLSGLLTGGAAALKFVNNFQLLMLLLLNHSLPVAHTTSTIRTEKPLLRLHQA